MDTTETQTPEAPDSEIINTDTIRINEVTVVHVSGPGMTLDRLSYTPAADGITGVHMNGAPLDLNGGKIIHVNVTFDGVSFDCDASMLQVLEDEDVRGKMIAGAKQAYADHMAAMQADAEARSAVGLGDHQDADGGIAIPVSAGTSPANAATFSEAQTTT